MGWLLSRKLLERAYEPVGPSLPLGYAFRAGLSPISTTYLDSNSNEQL